MMAYKTLIDWLLMSYSFIRTSNQQFSFWDFHIENIEISDKTYVFYVKTLLTMW